MNILKLIIFSWVVVVNLNCKSTLPEGSTQKVKVSINFGEETTNKEASINWYEGITALEVLQRCATVETRPVKDFVFVTAIDYVKGVHGETAWYYEVNGEIANLLSINNRLNPGDKVNWIFKTDVCSGTIN